MVQLTKYLTLPTELMIKNRQYCCQNDLIIQSFMKKWHFFIILMSPVVVFPSYDLFVIMYSVCEFLPRCPPLLSKPS